MSQYSTQHHSETFDIMKMGRQVVAKQRRKRATRVAVGGALIATGALIRGWLGVIGIGTGTYVIMLAARDGLNSMRSSRPSHDHDRVDEASSLSFPASDPPAMTAV